MRQTTRGRYRVYASPRAREELLLVDTADLDPTYVDRGGYDGALADRVEGLRAGYLVDAELEWDEEGAPRLTELSVREPTLFEFADGVTGVFEAARETWREARREGAGMNSQVTYGTDGDPNGALYTFAKQRGARDLFGEFRDGTRPLEPLLDRLDRPGPHEAFVMRPADEEFVLAYIVLEKGSILADTVRDTYDCPRPSEPLA